MIDVTAQLDRAQEMLRDLPEAAERAVAAALNRSAIAGRQAAVTSITSRYAAKSTDVRKMITLSTATPERLETDIRARSRALSLGYFPHTPRRAGTGGPGKPLLRTEIIRGSSKYLRPAFVAKLNSGLRIMRRTGKKTASGKEGIESIYTVPLALMLGVQSVREFVEERAVEVFDSRLEHEIDRQLGRMK